MNKRHRKTNHLRRPLICSPCEFVKTPMQALHAIGNSCFCLNFFIQQFSNGVPSRVPSQVSCSFSSEQDKRCPASTLRQVFHRWPFKLNFIFSFNTSSLSSCSCFLECMMCTKTANITLLLHSSQVSWPSGSFSFRWPVGASMQWRVNCTILVLSKM